MTISIQVCRSSSWDICPHVLHEVKGFEEAASLAYAISKQLECTTVRVTYLSDNWRSEFGDYYKRHQYIGRLSGSYFQSNQYQVQ
jgi:hypothetical protein